MQFALLGAIVKHFFKVYNPINLNFFITVFISSLSTKYFFSKCEHISCTLSVFFKKKENPVRFSSGKGLRSGNQIQSSLCCTNTNDAQDRLRRQYVAQAWKSKTRHRHTSILEIHSRTSRKHNQKCQKISIRSRAIPNFTFEKNWAQDLIACRETTKAVLKVGT